MTESDKLDFLRRSSCWQISASFIAALVLSASVLPAQDRADLPVCLAYWELSSNSLNSVADTNHGVVCGGAVFQDDAVLLNGRDAYISFGSSLTATNSISISLWMKAQPETDQQLLRVLGKFQIEGNNRDYCLFLNRGILFSFFSDNGSADAGHALLGATLIPAVSTQVWHHVAVTWNSAQGANGVALYCDAVSLAVTNLQSSDLQFLHAGSADLTLGAYDLPVTPDPVSPPSLTNAFRGSMCQLALFDGVLTPEDVADIAALGRFADLQEYFGDTPSSQPVEPGTQEPETRNPEPDNPEQRNEPASVNPRLVYVDAVKGDDINTGFSPELRGRDGPKRTVQGGLQIAGRGDTVCVSPGEYHEEWLAVPSGTRVVFEGHVVIDTPVRSLAPENAVGSRRRR